jgi:hypothetical protein
MGDQLVARPLPVHKQKNAHTQTLNVYALCGIRTHNSGFRASDDSADRSAPMSLNFSYIHVIKYMFETTEHDYIFLSYLPPFSYNKYTL